MKAHPNKPMLPTGITLKTRMSLWFTLVLAVICAVLLVATAAAYGVAARAAARTELTQAVEDEAQHLQKDHEFVSRLRNGELEQAGFLKGTVQLMVYGGDKEHVAGVFLFDELDGVDFSQDNTPREVELEGHQYYVYDAHVPVRHGDDLWVRGIVRVETSVWGLLSQNGALVALVLLLLAAAFFGGRLLAGRFLRPVREMDLAARDIQQSGDLSRRIPVSEPKDELSDLAEDVNHMLATLERNFEAERQFASSASHELRTPVSVILANCEYAEDDASSEEELRRVIAAIHRQGVKMSGIIEALLMLTRMDQGTEKYGRARMDLSAFVRGTCEDFARMVPEEVRVSCEVEDGVEVVANERLVGMAISNLLRNAVRYGCTSDDGGNVRVSLEACDGMARVVVSDDGPGIPDGERDRIWEIFYRADESRSTEGLGLGLPLVRKIAEFHGGRAYVAASASDPGATFVIELPLLSSSC